VTAPVARTTTTEGVPLNPLLEWPSRSGGYRASGCSANQRLGNNSGKRLSDIRGNRVNTSRKYANESIRK